jgi:flagellar basal-body rod modification protein FlgD
MAFDALSSISTPGAPSGLNQSRASIADNFDTFLSILTTQLKNQNPLEPLKTAEFTSQLVQFTSVEQQLKTNEYLEALINANKVVGQTQATSFIGRTVSASSAVTQLNGGSAVWNFSLAADAPDAQVTIRNLSGDVVFSDKMSLARGEHSFQWDGLDPSGIPLNEGSYAITVEAKDADGNNVSVSTQTTGVVEGVDFGGDEPVLLVGGARLRLSSVQMVTD